MIRAGWANVYVYNGVPFQRVRAFRRAQAQARTASRGVWQRCGGDSTRAVSRPIAVPQICARRIAEIMKA